LEAICTVHEGRGIVASFFRRWAGRSGDWGGGGREDQDCATFWLWEIGRWTVICVNFHKAQKSPQNDGCGFGYGREAYASPGWYGSDKGSDTSGLGV